MRSAIVLPHAVVIGFAAHVHFTTPSIRFRAVSRSSSKGVSFAASIAEPREINSTCGYGCGAYRCTRLRWIFASTPESAFRQSILIPRLDSSLTLACENGFCSGCDRYPSTSIRICVFIFFLQTL